MEPIRLELVCPICGGQRTLEYDDRVHVACDSCDALATFGVPPAAFADRERDEIPAVASRYLRAELARLENGFCPYCDGRIERHVGAPDPDEPLEGVDDCFPVVRYECQQCGAEPTSGLTIGLFSHPAVVAFSHDHGIAIREHPVWEFPLFGSEAERIEGEDPFRASATFSLDGDELTITVDENFEVVGVA